MSYALLLGMGLLVGGFSATIGIGGGILIVPLLPHILPVSATEAIATSLATIFLVTVRNTFGFWRGAMLSWRSVLPLGVAAGAASLTVSSFAARASELVLKTTFTLTLIGLFLFVVVRKQPSDSSGDHQRAVPKGWLWVLLGTFCGSISGGTGVGSGVVAGPLIIRLRLVEAARVVPLVNGMMLMNTACGLIGFAMSAPEWKGWHWGPVWWEAALMIFVGAQFVATFAIRHQSRMSERLRRRVLTVLLALLSVHSSWEAIQLWLN